MPIINKSYVGATPVIRSYYGGKLVTGSAPSVGWSPSALFSQGQMGVWYDPADLLTLFQDAEGTIPVTTAGEPVGLMLDKSGNDNHALQNVATARPTYQANGSQRWIEGNGIDQYMATSRVHTANRTIVAALMLTENSGDTKVVYGGRSSSNARSYMSFKGTDSRPNSLSAGVGGDSNVYIYANDDDLNKNIVGSLIHGTNVQLRRNGALVIENALIGSSAPGAASYIFTLNDGGIIRDSLFFGGRVYGIVDTDVLLSETDRVNTEAYLADKVGIAL